MDNITFESVSKYFTHLSNVGYFRQSNVDKLILLIFMQELIDRDFRGLVSEDDYKDINKALYCLYGSNCLIPYPDYYNTKTRRTMYIGSMSELAHRVEALEDSLKIEEILDKQVIIPGDEPANNDNNKGQVIPPDKEVDPIND